MVQRPEPTPSTLRTRGNIAAGRGRRADPAEALRLFRALLPGQERVLGPDHPNTLATRYWIADLRQQIGEESWLYGGSGPGTVPARMACGGGA